MIFIVSNSLFGQVSNLPGAPLVKNFTEEDVNTELTVFDISQSSAGIMYFATPNGLLEFDGVRWNNFKYGLESDLRAVLYKDDQHIYTSGHGGFGFWSKNDFGSLEYTSLFFKQPLKQSPLLPVFSSIKEVDGQILFQTFQRIYIYNPTTGTIDTISAEKGFNLMFLSKERAFIQDVGIGLFEIKGKKLEQIEGTNAIGLEILNVFVNYENELLIITKNKGIWSWKNKILTKKRWEINGLLEKYLVSDAKEYKNDKLIIGTIRKGVYVVSANGEVLLHQEKNNGLRVNNVRKVFIDINKNIWLGMEKGLSYVQINSNTNYLIDNEGDFGTVYTSHLKDSLLYFGTNQGLFVKNITLINSKAELIDETIGQIWELKAVDGQILVGSHEGLYLLENKKLKLVHKEGGAWVFRKHPKIENLLYVGFYSGIGVYKRINGNWIFQKKWDNYGESSRFIEFDKYGHLWVTHPSKGYYRLSLSSNGIGLEEYEFYGIDNNNVNTYAYMCKLDGDLIFYNPDGFFAYDLLDNSFVPQKYPSELFKNIKDVNYIAQYDNVFWYSSPKSLGFIHRDKDQFNSIYNPFYSLRNKHLNDFNKVQKINDSIYAIGINDGIIFHKVNSTDLEKNKVPPMIRSIQLIGEKDTIIAPINKSNGLEVPYNNSFVKFNLALPRTPLTSSYKVQYRLNGLNDDWSSWDYISELNFPSLTSGSYKLELRAGGIDETISETVSRAFVINPPWYRSKIAFFIYIFLLLIINSLYRSYFKKQGEKQLSILKQLEEEKRKREKEKFKLEKLKVDKELFTLKEENLNLEIKKKNTELATATLNNIKKNELLNGLITDLNNIEQGVINSALHSPIKKVIKKIDKNLSDKDDWLTFELHFRNAHTDFFDKLREKHPNLSSNEIKLSAYLKLNLSSKEIASLLNISIKSVEQGRWRLRKKLELFKDTSLVNYIQSF